MTKPNDTIGKFEYLDARLKVDFETGVIVYRDNELVPKHKRGTVAGCPNNRKYLRLSVTLCGKAFQVKAHRFVWWKAYGMPVPDVINHINNVKDDNRLANLEPDDTPSNTRKDSPSNKWFYQGVRRSSKNSWGAMVKINGKRIWKGGFESALAAASWYVMRVKQWELTGD